VLKMQSLNHKRLLITKIYRLLFYPITLLILLLLIPAAVLADLPLHIALFDTPICSGYNYNQIYPHVTIAKTTWPDEIKPDRYTCPKDIDQKFYRSLHGHYVLRSLLSNLNSKRKIIIHPLVVFNRSGEQRLEYWNSALRWSAQNSVDIQVIATGLLIKNINISKLKLTNFSLVAAGNIGLGVDSKTRLWPQHSRSRQMVLIGSYLPSKLPAPHNRGIYLDPNQLNQKQIKWAFDGSGARKIRFGGTSYAVAIATAKIINICPQESSTLPDCMKQAAKKLIFSNSQRTDISTLP
jgi:hypothetical protein